MYKTHNLHAGLRERIRQEEDQTEDIDGVPAGMVIDSESQMTLFERSCCRQGVAIFPIGRDLTPIRSPCY